MRRALDTIFFGKAEVLIDVGTHLVRIEMHCIKAESERLGQSCLARARQTHHQYFSLHASIVRPSRRSTKASMSPTTMHAFIENEPGRVARPPSWRSHAASGLSPMSV